MPHDTRDAVVDHVRTWSGTSDIAVSLVPCWVGITASKYHDWKNRFGRVNEHNSWVLRDHHSPPSCEGRESGTGRRAAGQLGQRPTRSWPRIPIRSSASPA